MRLAIISVTNHGALLAQRLVPSLAGEIDTFARNDNNPGAAQSYDHLGRLVATLFHQYDGLIFVMPVGLVVRVIAPHVRDKRYDPAVVVVDEAGSYTLSLLSGHLGGANALTKQIGDVVGASSVITTANGFMEKPAIDILAVKLDAAIEPFDQLKQLNAAIVNGERVAFFVDQSLEKNDTYLSTVAEMEIELSDMKELSQADEYDAAVVITDKDLYMVKPHIFLRPATLAVGIECQHDTTSSEILNAIADVCKKIGRSMKSIAVIGLSTLKEDEIGALAAAQQLEVPVRFYSDQQLRHAANSGKGRTGSACELAALLAGKADHLILENTVFSNMVLAVAEVQSRWWE